MVFVHHYPHRNSLSMYACPYETITWFVSCAFGYQCVSSVYLCIFENCMCIDVSNIVGSQQLVWEKQNLHCENVLLIETGVIKVSHACICHGSITLLFNCTVRHQVLASTMTLSYVQRHDPHSKARKPCQLTYAPKFCRCTVVIHTDVQTSAGFFQLEWWDWLGFLAACFLVHVFWWYPCAVEQSSPWLSVHAFSQWWGVRLYACSGAGDRLYETVTTFVGHVFGRRYETTEDLLDIWRNNLNLLSGKPCWPNHALPSVSSEGTPENLWTGPQAHMPHDVAKHSVGSKETYYLCV